MINIEYFMKSCNDNGDNKNNKTKASFYKCRLRKLLNYVTRYASTML